MQTYDYSGFIYVIIAAIAFLIIKLSADYITSSRHYSIDFEKKNETNAGKRLSSEELMEVIEKAYETNDARRATKGLPVPMEELNFNQENNKVTLTTDEVDYSLNQLAEQGKIIRYKNLLASSSNGEESIGAYYIYELAMKKNSHAIQNDYKKMLKTNHIVMAKNVDELEDDSDASIITLGIEQANSLRKKMYSYDSRGGYLLFLLSNGMIKCIEA